MDENIFEKSVEEIKEEALTYLEEKKFKDLRECLVNLNPADIANLMESMPEESIPLVFRILPKDAAADSFAYLDNDIQEILIKAFSDSELKQVIDELYLDDAVDLVEEMPANVVKRIIKNASPDVRAQINELLNYPKDSAGSIMTTEFVDLKKDMTVAEAFERIKKTGVDKETIYTCYVTDKNRLLLGLVTAKKLLLSEPTDIIEDIMETNVISVTTVEDKEVVGNIFNHYDFLALPVVDEEHRLVGIVTVDDAIDVIHEETEEDFARMAAITTAEDSYLKTSAFKHAKNRIPWLILLMFTSTITGSIISGFEEAISALPVMVSFIPMLMDTGGNCGSQASVTIIRGLALDEIKIKDIFKVIWKEFSISLMVGTALAVFNFFWIWFVSGQMIVGAVVAVTLFAVVILAKFIGCCMPILAKAVHLDPALVSSPIITTIVDMCAVTIYFTIVTFVMGKYM